MPLTPASPPQPDLPYDGLTVLDLSQGVSGPYCALVLRQQGARVIKVEPPAGDWARRLGRQRGGHSAVTIAMNAGKESVVLDARRADERAILQELARSADVVVQNFRPGVAERLGAGYEDVAAGNPGVVYVSVSAYGPRGELSGRGGLDTGLQAETGLMYTNRDPSGRPRRIGLLIVDLTAGLYAAQATGAALFRCARTGRGRHVEVSMLHTGAALQSYILADDAMFAGEESAVLTAPSGLFDATDGTLYITTLDDAMFRRLAAVLDVAKWREDDSLARAEGRLGRLEELNARVQAVIATRSLAHWQVVLAAHDIVYGRAAHPRDLLEHPQALANGLFTSLDQPAVGSVPWTGVPGAGADQAPPGPAPALGEHTAAVLAELDRPDRAAVPGQ